MNLGHVCRHIVKPRQDVTDVILLRAANKKCDTE